MQCMFTSPTDPALRCTRESSVVATHSIRLTHPLQQSEVATSYAYTCLHHKDAAPAIAEARSRVWGVPQPVAAPAPTVALAPNAPCCLAAEDFDGFPEEMRGTDHDDDCVNYDGAPAAPTHDFAGFADNH